VVAGGYGGTHDHQLHGAFLVAVAMLWPSMVVAVATDLLHIQYAHHRAWTFVQQAGTRQSMGSVDAYQPVAESRRGGVVEVR